MIKINLNILQAALICCAKNDVRYYLRGIYISVDRVAATDGSRLFSYDLSSTYAEGGINEVGEEFTPFIIPGESIKQLIKSLPAKERKGAEVEVIISDGQYSINCIDSIVNFQPVDGKFPNIDRVIPSDYEPVIHNCYRWKYMDDFSKIAVLLGDRLGTAKLKPNGNQSALVELQDSRATCIIMPMRD